MPISRVTAAHFLTKLTNDASQIGEKANYTLAITSNSEAVALEYLIAHRLAAVAAGRLKAATKAAIASDVLRDFTQFPLETGHHDYYIGDVVCISVDVRSPVEVVDAHAFRRELLLAGVPRNDIDNAWNAATKQCRPAHTVRPTLRTDDGSADTDHNQA